ncbi:MAG: class I SAM-dependent rRNA methyltransferase [Alphaproteobacteria bacterium]|nr:class I SAM-dependent rRNA methyltransferase [Alphaproteobacteria bacterium]
MADDPKTRPVIALLPGRQKRAEGGHPWIYSNEVAMTGETKALPAGGLVTVKKADGKALGVATFNAHPLVSARLISRDATHRIDAAFFLRVLRRALAIREALFEAPFYRLVHAEADGLPGLVIDRFGTALVCQLNTAGMALLEGELLAALDELLAPAIIVLRNDSPARLAEGLGTEVRIAKGTLDGPVELVEDGIRFKADLLAGQKTGWFYDQRANRRFMAGLAGGRRVLDLYAFTGGFAVRAAVAGAREVLAIDRSEAALALAGAAAEKNGVAARCAFRRAEAFAELERLRSAGERFDIVVADPPAFVKSRKDLAAGLRGYRKLAALAAPLVAKGGFLFLASCSHNADPPSFAEAVARGIHEADRTARILRSAGADADHPVHPALPESAYLKAQVFMLD